MKRARFGEVQTISILKEAEPEGEEKLQSDGVSEESTRHEMKARDAASRDARSARVRAPAEE